MSTDSKRRMTVVADLFAPVVALLFPFANFLQFQDYALMSPEILLIVLGIVLVGLCLGALIVLLGTVARVMLLSVVIIVSVDFTFQFWFWRPMLFAGVAGGVVVMALLLREHLNTITVSTFTVLLLTNTVASHGSVAWRNGFDRGISATDDSLTPMIHLILDGHLGVEGLLPSQGDVARRKQEAIDLYVENGFRLYGHAYSQYYHTLDTIPNLLNFTVMPEAEYYFDSFYSGAPLLDNEYFRRMSEMGYGIRVYQTEYMDYCNGTHAELIEFCETTPSNSLKAIENLNLPPSHKARVILSLYLKLSVMYQGIRDWYNVTVQPALLTRGLDLPRWTWERPIVFSLTAPSMIERIGNDVVARPDGVLFFAHLGLPHHPFAFDKNCNIKESVSMWFDSHTGTSGEAQDERIGHYLAQEECTRKLISGFLSKLRSAGVLDRAKIIVHGDHGTRISSTVPDVRNRERFTTADHLQYFSVLFAAKEPFAVGRYVSTEASLSHLFEAALSGDEVGPERESESATVFWGGGGSKLIEVPMVWK